MRIKIDDGAPDHPPPTLGVRKQGTNSIPAPGFGVRFSDERGVVWTSGT